MIVPLEIALVVGVVRDVFAQLDLLQRTKSQP
jgi:hypothetical protein